jgi:hypothetical protein
MPLQYPGEYAQPQTRHQEVRVPVVPGYTTARLAAIPPINVPDAGTALSMYSTLVGLQNTGDVSVTVQLKQTDNQASGPRSNIGPAVALTPGGFKDFTVYPDQKYLELWGAGSNESTVRMSLDSKIRWSVLGFAKTDATYPPQLWEANVPDINSLT